MKKLTSIFVLGFLFTSLYATSSKEPAPAPDFSLKGSDGKTYTLADAKKAKKWVVLEWLNHGCPFVKKHYESNNMQGLQKQYTSENPDKSKRVLWYSIISSAKGEQGYGVTTPTSPHVAAPAPTAVLEDETGKVGHAYGALTTPTMVIINPEGKIVYFGAIDSKRSDNVADVATAEKYFVNALDEALASKTPNPAERKSYGCGIKYKKTDA